MRTHHFVAAILLLAAACKESRADAPTGSGTAEAADPGAGAVVARTDSWSLTAGEVDERAGLALRAIEDECRKSACDKQQAALEPLILRRIIEGKARAEKLTVEEYEEREVWKRTPEPTAAEIRDAYARAVAGGERMPPLGKAKAGIASFLREMKQREAALAWHEEIKKEAKVELLSSPWEPPRDAKADPRAPVARMTSGTITAGEVAESVKDDLRLLEYRCRKRAYDARQDMLDALILLRIVESKARQEKLPVADYLRRDVLARLVDPTEEEVAEAVEAWGVEARREAKVVLLPHWKPPRIEVAAAGPSKGPSNAPITIVEFSAFSEDCGPCRTGEETMARLLEAYPGRIRLVFRDFPYGEEKLHEAAHCAEDQGRYWEMHARLMATTGDVPPEEMKRTARGLGLDGPRFNRCLDSGEKAARVDASREAGAAAGATGAPSFFINGLPLYGAKALAEFTEIVDRELGVTK